VLCDQYGNPLAVMDIESRFAPNKDVEVKGVYGTDDRMHPGVRYVMNQMHDLYMGGTNHKFQLEARHDFKELRYMPEELKAVFREKGWYKVVAFQTRNPMHRVYFELVKCAHEKTGLPVLVHPVVSMTSEGDIEYILACIRIKLSARSTGKILHFLHCYHLQCVWLALVKRFGT